MLGVATLGVEDVLIALRHFGAVRIEVADGGGFACIVEVPDESPERAQGTTVLHAALACWAVALESAQRYSELGIARLERFLALEDDAA